MFGVACYQQSHQEQPFMREPGIAAVFKKIFSCFDVEPNSIEDFLHC